MKWLALARYCVYRQREVTGLSPRAGKSKGLRFKGSIVGQEKSGCEEIGQQETMDGQMKPSANRK